MAGHTASYPGMKAETPTLARYLPFLNWLRHYRREDLSGDLIAGVVVAVMLVPQGMAYALLAGLPPELGLYASIVPPIIYGLLGTSRALAVGPVALGSLLVAAGVAQMNPASSAETLMLVITLALMVGLMQIGLGLLRAGFLVSFLSHPVLAGFTSATAIVIIVSQLKHILGVSVANSDAITETLLALGEKLGEINPSAVLIGLGGIAILLYFKNGLKAHLQRLGLSAGLVSIIPRTGPLLVVALGTLLVTVLNLNETSGLNIVGAVPAGLPPLTLPSFDLSLWQRLLPIAITIAVLGYMESIGVAKALASKRREKVDASQELVALGAANLGASFTGAYPVMGGIGRSMVNYSAGANTGLASIITASLMLLTVLFLTPLFYNLPNAVLAAIIVVAVVGMVDWQTFRQTWRYNRADALSMAVTFGLVLFAGIETGIAAGVLTALGLYLWRTSRPHIAVVGRVGSSEHFRNVLRHEVQTHPRLLMVRVDESLYFPNAQYLEDTILGLVADHAQVRHLVLVCSAVNSIDSSALESLNSLRTELADAGVQFYLAEVKGPVMDRLRGTDFIEALGPERIFLSAHQAMTTICAAEHESTSERELVPVA